MLGNVYRNFHAGLFIFPRNNLVLQHEMHIGHFIASFPNIELILGQAGIGTIRTGTISSLQCLIAFLSPIATCSQQFLASWIQVIQLVGVHIANVDNISLGFQHRLEFFAFCPFSCRMTSITRCIFLQHLVPLQTLPIHRGILIDVKIGKILHGTGLGEQEALQYLGPQLGNNCQLIAAFYTLTAHTNFTLGGPLQHVA